jgi:hypothetical protein
VLADEIRRERYNRKIVLVPITVVLAVYAAVVATATGVVQISNYRRDRARIRVDVGHNMRILTNFRYANKMLTIVTVSNEGRRPVTITSVGARQLYPHDHFVIEDCQPPLPHELTEGNCLRAILPSRDMDFSNVESWFASNALGRTYLLHVAPWYSRTLSHARLRRKWRRDRATAESAGSSGGD